MFKQDLKNSIKNKLIYIDAKINSIQILIEITISIDNKLYKQNIEKRYNQSYRKSEISFKSVVRNYTKRDYFKKYSNPDYCKSVSIELNFIQQRKKKNQKEKQNNKNSKTYYLYNKSDYFARDCCLKNLIILQQINTILKEIFDNQNNIRKQTDTETNISEIELNNNYYLIENSDQLQKILDIILSDKISVSIQKINKILKKIIKAEQLNILYFYSVTDSDNKYN